MNDHNNNRRDDEEYREEVELTAAEKEAFEKLPKDRVPSRAMEDRLVGELRGRGFLKPARHRVIELTALRKIAALAACVVLLAVGFFFGQLTGSHQPADEEHEQPGNDNFAAAATLQQAGSAYLLALEHLTDLPNNIDDQQAAQGQEVAVSTLCTAADRIAHMVPKSVLAGRLLAALETDADRLKSGGHDQFIIENNRVIEF
jgi:hypothetical protein